MKFTRTPLWSIATVNDEVLPDDTDADFEFTYIDIASISDNRISNSTYQVSFRESPSRARRVVQLGDIALSTVRTYLRAIAPVTEDYADAVFSTGFAIIRPDQTVCNPSFLRYALLSDEFIDEIVSHSNGVSYPSINAGEIMRIYIDFPALETQQRIADYLDRETSEIDAAVADLDKYVELLEKRRTLRLIEETRIRSSARMTTIGRHAQVSLGKTLQPEQKSQNEQLVNYVRAGNIQPNGVFDGEAKQMWMTPDEQSAYSLLPGDVLVVEGGAGFGRSLTLNLGLQGWGFQNHVIRIRPQSGWIGKFIDYSIRAHKTDGLIDLLAVGATIPGFSADKARNLPIAFLTEREQSEVVQTLDKDMDEIDSLIAESTRLRDLLLKRRSVLITEVVTGRKQV